MRRDDERLTERDRDIVGRAADIRRKYHLTAQDNQRAPVEHCCDARAFERTGAADDSDGESARG
jgi:hypothetical protein